MSDHVETMFSVKINPWHGRGVIISEDNALNLQDGLLESGLDWTVRKEQLITMDNQIVTNGYATIRESDNRVLGIVGEGYQVLQNWEAFGFFEAFLETGLIRLETAGSLMQGSRIWVLAKMVNGKLEITEGDDVESYLLLSHSHDGTLKVRVGFTPVRVVCMNTLTAAHSDKASKFVTSKHTKNVKEKLETVKTTINLMTKEFEATAEIYRAMVDRMISSVELEKYIRASLNLNSRVSKLKTMEDDGDLTPERTLNLINRIKRYYEESPGNDLPNVRGSLWAAFQGVSYYLNYDRGHSDDTRLTSLFWGDSHTKMEKALIEAINLL